MASMQHLPGSTIEGEIRYVALTLWDKVKRDPELRRKPGIVGDVAQWAMHDEPRKIAVLRLIDVLPALRSPEEVAEHIAGYLADDTRALPAHLRLPIRVMARSPLRGVLATTFHRQVAGFARRFIAGSGIRDALPVLESAWRAGFAFTADLLGERTLTTGEVATYRHRYEELIDTLSEVTARWPAAPRLESDTSGGLPRANVSLKLSALDPSLTPADLSGSVDRLTSNVVPLLWRARECNVFVNFDMEDWSLHEIAMRVFERCALDAKLRDWPHMGIVVQAYLRCAHEDLERLLRLSEKRGAPITVRLVKGAYWDYEVAMSEQEGSVCPVFRDKETTDANFEHLTLFLLEHARRLKPAIASHNLRSVSHALVQAQWLNVDAAGLEVQMLYGMAESEQRALRDAGYRVRVYTPIGELVPGMAYLVRRLLENTSNQGFLRMAYREGIDMERLLRKPRFHAPSHRNDRPETTTPASFQNCPHLDFTDTRARDRFAGAVASVGATFPREVPIVISGEQRRGEFVHSRECPSAPDVVVAHVAMASASDAEDAIAAAASAWPEWNATAIAERAERLEQIAERLETDREVLAALEVYETAKPWREADADVAEAIDFCRYYAQQARVELSPRALDSPPGEMNTMWYDGRGVTAVIAPWNFPVAILCGMTAAALVAGNTVVMKPSEQSSACAYELFRHIQAAGVPANVVQFLPGRGDIVGQRLVEDSRVAAIAFTGSKEVGLRILERAGKVAEGQREVKAVVCEMGGKNAIIIDNDADLDEAVSGVLISAFGYAGQKCSACSRVITVGSCGDLFAARLVEACARLRIAPAHDPACEVGPVIDRESCERLIDLVERPPDGVECLYRGEPRNDGWYVPPAIFRATDPGHPFMHEELFGPILTWYHAATFEEALRVALSTPFALTGGVYSRNPKHIATARAQFRVGNLYINRPCTGARVGRQPFGGFGMSGTGTKAGGPGYLAHFAVPRCATENTMRKGFSPEIVEPGRASAGI